MEVFRLMSMPDKVIAFNNLPERLLSGFEMLRADGFPRYWKEWMGKKKRTIRIPPERDPLTNQIRRFDPIYEEDYFFYVVDWTIKPVEEKWKEICDYVRQNVSKEIRITENLADMAKPLAENKTDGVTLDPEEVTVITLPVESASLISSNGENLNKVKVPEEIYKCGIDGCDKVFDDKRGIRMHNMKKHSEKKDPVTV